MKKWFGIFFTSWPAGNFLSLESLSGARPAISFHSGLAGLAGLWASCGRVKTTSEGRFLAGGRPGVYPSLTEPNDQMRACGLYPPHGFNVDLLPFRASLAKQDESKRARGRQVEINNGRLAMLGIFSLISEQKVPGAVPFLSGKIPTLPDMEIMGPFVGTDGVSHIF